MTDADKADKIAELEDKVLDLKDRVGYLERELDISIHEQRFENRMERIFANTVDGVDVTTGTMGAMSAKARVYPGEVGRIGHEVEAMDGYAWQVTGSDEGTVTVKITEGASY